MSYAKSLQDILKDKDPTLYSRLEVLRPLAVPVLNYTAAGFPFYTPHGFSHSESTEENLNWLVPDEIKPKMNASEIFFLLVACWMHDWGMVCKPGEKPESIRANHHIRTEQNFEQMHSLLNLDPHESRIIGRIARGHREEDLMSSLFDEQIYRANIHIDVRFLAALLRLADECDVTHSRVPEIIYFSLSPDGASEQHFKAHLSIQGIGKSNEWPHKIQIQAIARDPRASETVRRLGEKIQKEIDQVKGILAEHGIPIDRVEVQVQARGFIDKPISFRLDQNRITRLLIGESLYSRKDVAIRELLQNAVDACRTRRGLQPDASVSIRIHSENGLLVVQDNGMGMDYEKALTYLANKGFSYYESDEFKELQKKLDFDPVSRWGLGILSCFLIASKVTIETKMEGKDACKFIVENVGEGWRYEEGSMGEPGTIVTLVLNDEGSKIDLEKALRHYLKMSPIHIFIGRDSTEPLQFNWTPEDTDVKDEMQFHAKFQQIPRHEHDDSDISVRHYPPEDPKWLGGRLFLANQGFYIGRADEVIPYAGGVTLVNFKKDIIDLNVSREHVRTDTTKSCAAIRKYVQILAGFADEEYQRRRPRSLVCEASAYQQILREYGLLVPFLRWILNPETHPLQRLLQETMTELICERPFNIVLTPTGLCILSLNDIVRMKPQRISLFSIFPGSRVQEQVELVEALEANKLDLGEIIIFDFESPGSSGDPLTLLSVIGGAVAPVRHVSWGDILRPEPMPIEGSPDYLLPEGAQFAHLPPLLRGLVIPISPYIFNAPSDYADHEDYLRVAIGLSEPGKTPEQRLEVNKTGKLLFDADDDFNSIVIQAHEGIKASGPLQEIVKNYFRLVAYVQLGRPAFLAYEPITECVLGTKENEILSLISKPRMKDLENPALRWSPMWRGISNLVKTIDVLPPAKASLV